MLVNSSIHLPSGFLIARSHRVAVLVLEITLPHVVGAQAWLPGRGEGSVFISYEYFDGNDHVFSTDIIDGASARGYVAEGNRWFLGDTYSNDFIVGADYGIRDRLAVSASLTYVSSAYEGRAPANPEVDDGDYHGTLQDASVRLRAQILARPLVVTPFVGVQLPTSNYVTNGHTSPGRHITELQMGLGLGRHLDPLLSDAYFSGSFTYGLNEKVRDLRLWRTSFDAEVGYFVHPRLSVQAIGSALWTHGGFEWIDPVNFGSVVDCWESCEPWHVGITNARYMRVGGCLSWSMRQDLQLTLGALTTAWGENVDDADYFFSGIDYAFRMPFATEDEME